MIIPLIPTFKPGQRVVLDYHPYEMTCPKCGKPWGTSMLPFREAVIIIDSATGGIIGCNHCGASFSLPDGYYLTDKFNVNGYRLIVPWPLLTPLEEEVL